ncbi:MAG TPA: sulfurtransferase, partial [Thermoanaerobaculia bacterium]|nr:sulfurtransferase [Thermoanaerobaculia bacterium]
MSEYAHPEVLVSTDWVKEHLDDPKVKLVEIDVDTQAYAAGHVPGAVGLNWQSQLQDPIRRDIVSKEEFERLMGEAGITPDDTVVLYGDNNNWFAAYGFWLMKLYGHPDVRLMNGGRVKWLNEDDKELTPELPEVTPTTYRARGYHPELRAKIDDVKQVLQGDGHNLVDVRSPDEFTGKIIAPPGMAETAQRAGHIPGARNVPWSTAVAPDGTFKSADELREIYLDGQGVDPAKPTIAYCRIGERSSHTWFVLKHLLGIDNVKNYDGSWTEYGSLIDVPIE